MSLSFLIIFFLVIPIVKNVNFFESFEMIKVLLFIGVTNVYLAIVSSLHYYRTNVKIDKLLIIWSILWVFLAFSSLLNGNQSQSWFGQFYRYQGLITLLAGIEFVFLVSKIDFKPKLTAKLISSFGFVNSLIIFGQYVLINWFNQPVYSFFDRMTANLGNPNFAGGFIALAAAYSSPVLWPIYFGAIILTQSRSALIAFGVVCLLKSFVYLKNKFFKIAIIFFSIGLVLIALPYRQKSDFEDRQVIWPKALMAISQKPIFGWGVENFSIAFQSVLKDNEFDLKNIRVDKAHNEFLEVATTGGIVAFLIYLLIWFLIVKNLWLRKNEPGMENNLIGLAAFFIIANLNVMSIAEYLFFYFIAGISINGRNKLRPYN
jgi:hypothetical protein